MVVLLVSARFAVKTEWARNYAESRIEALSIRGQSVKVGDIEGDLLGAFSISDLEVSDEQGAWLNASNVSVKWHYMALLRGALDVELVEAASLNVLREPVMAEADTNRPKSETSFLKSYDVSSIILPSVTISEGITPQDLNIKLVASFSQNTRRLTANLEASSEPLARDAINVSLDWPTRDNPAASYRISGKQGGLLMTLLKLEDAQSIAGSGDLGVSGEDEFYGNASISIDDRTALTAKLIEQSGAISLEASIVPSVHPLFRPYADYLDDRIDIKASATRSDIPATAEVSIVSGSNRIALSASEKGLWDLNAQIVQPHRLIASDGVTIESVNIDGAVSLGDAQSFDGVVDVRSVKQAGIQLARTTGPLKLSRAGNVISSELDFELSGIRVDGQKLVPKTAQIRMVGDFNTQTSEVRLDIAKATSQGLKLTAKGRFSAADPIVADLSGTAQVEGQVFGIDQLERASTNWAVKHQASGRSVIDFFGAARLSQISQLSNTPVAYKGRLRLEPNGEIKLSPFELTQDDRSVSLNILRTPMGKLSADIVGAIPNIEIGSFASYNTRANLALRLNGGSISGEGYVSSDKLNASGQDLERLRIDFSDAKINGTNGELALQASASYLATPLTLSTIVAASVDDGRVALDDFKANWGDLNVTGAAIIPYQNLEQMNVDLAISGSVKEIEFIEQINADLRIADQSVSGTAKLQGLTIGGLQNGLVDTRFNGDFETLRLETSIGGGYFFQDRVIPVEFSGPLNISNILTSDRGVAVGGRGSAGPLDFEIKDEVIVSLSEEFGLLANAQLKVAGGDIDFALRPSQNERLSLTAKGLKLSPIFQLFGQLPRAGDLNLAFNLNTNADGYLTGLGSLGLSGLQGIDGKVSDFSLSSQIDVQPEFVSIQLDETGLEELVFNAKLRLPLSIDARMLRPIFQTDSRIEFDVASRGTIGPITDLFLPATSALDGEVDIAVEGQIVEGRPLLRGKMDVTKGTFEQSDIGLNLQNISLSAAIENDTITLANFDASGVSGGTISGGGQFQIGAIETARSDIKVDRLVIFDRAEGRAVTSGTLSFGSNGTRPVLKGGLSIDEALIDLDKLPQAGPPTLDITFAEDLEAEEKSTDNGIVGVDVTVRSQRGIRIKGRGVDATMGLDLVVQGKLVSPTIIGEARIVRGVFELLGKRFEITPSVLRLADPLSDSQLNMEATREDAGYKYSVSVVGSISRPEIKLSSDPALPEDEVLSRVLFGRSPSQLSGLEAARLAAALAQLSGGGGFDLLGGIEQQLGLDRLSVDQTSSGAAALTTGKYLSDDVYVEVRTGATGLPGLSIEWQALNNLEVEAETTPDEGQTLSVKWKTDFD
jgi:autotransporter translocation and assembly factor TamB